MSYLCIATTCILTAINRDFKCKCVGIICLAAHALTNYTQNIYYYIPFIFVSGAVYLYLDCKEYEKKTFFNRMLFETWEREPILK